MSLRPFAAASLLVALASLCLSAAAQTVNKEDVSKGGEVYTAKGCAACHGEGGNSMIETNPKLSGQFAQYLSKQMHEFKPSKEGAKPARENATMTAMATPLSDDEIRQLAAFLSQQKLQPASATNPDLATQGRALYRAGVAAKSVAACAGCHGPTAAGNPIKYPRLGGQSAVYIEAQLKGFRDGTRTNSAEMTQIAANLSDKEIHALADYIAGVR